MKSQASANDFYNQSSVMARADHTAAQDVFFYTLMKIKVLKEILKFTVLFVEILFHCFVYDTAPK